MPEAPTLPYDGAKIKKLREQRGMTIEAFADLIGRHPATIKNLEGNRKNASRAMLLGIALGLGVPLNAIATVDCQSRKAS